MKIVVGYLPTEAGEAALETAIQEARSRNAELLVLHSSPGGAAESSDEIDAMRNATDKVDHRLRDEGIAFEFREFVRGNTPAEDIIRSAEEEKADLVVIGLRKRSLTGKLVLGSTAHDVLMHAPCPVLSVRAD